MDTDPLRRNAESLERLGALARRLTDEQLAVAIDAPWTAAALFAHMAFWDRFTDARWEAARHAGNESPASIPDEALERINLASLHQWLLLPPPMAVQECLAAAAAVDARIAELPTEVVDSVGGSERRRLVDRSLHRSDHLGTIEAAFSS